jgi:hypothetical protein
MNIYLIYIAAWFGLMIVAILNGTLRTFGFAKVIPELRAHQLSCFTGILLIGLAVWLLDKKWEIESKNQAFLIGFIWIVMTVIFEFVFGHYVMKHPWERLLHDYRIDEGRLWILVLIWTAIVPFVVFSIGQAKS